MRRGLLLPGAAVLAAALGGCGPFVPSDPGAPLAVRLDGEAIQVLYLDCKPAPVRSVTVIRVEAKKHVLDGKEPVVWRVDFEPPSAATQFVVGKTDGGVESTPLDGPLDPAARYDVAVGLKGAGAPHSTFRLEKLAKGQVMLRDEYVSAEKFAARKGC